MRTIILTAGLFALVAQQAPREVIRGGVTYVTTDLVVRNDSGQFVATREEGLRRLRGRHQAGDRDVRAHARRPGLE
jgi:hypothetical protein